MKQYQISYQNKAGFSNYLAEIRSICNDSPYSGITFYITWANNAQSDLKAVTDAIEAVFPDADYYGNEASGSIIMGDLAYGINITCYLFEGQSTGTELVWVEKGTELSTMDDLWNYCNTKENLAAVELIPSIAYLEVLGIDGNVPSVSDDILIFGGASVNYDNSTYDADIIAKGHPSTRNGMAVMLYYGKDLAFSVGNVLGWKGLGRLMEVTDSTGKCIREIDHNPAYSIYEKYLNLTTEDKDTLVFPLIVEEDGNEFIRTPQTVMKDKSMQMFADIPKGTKVRISYGDKNTILGNIYDKAEEIADFAPDAIKAYSCAARRLFWGDAEISKETRILDELAPVCGFYTGGEILKFGNRLRVLNQTLAIVAIREGAQNPERQIELNIKALDKSLVSRLAYFTEKVSEEELREHAELKENMDIIGGLASEYTMLYHIDFDKGTFKNYVANDRVADMKAMLPASVKMSDLRNIFLQSGLVHPDDVDKVADFFDNGHLELTDKKSANILFRRKYGDEYLWTRAIAVKCEDVSEPMHTAILGFMECDKEIRKEHERQQRLQEALSMAQAADRAKTNFLFNMSHDIRTPMNAIMGFTGMAIKHIDDREKATDCLNKIQQSGALLLSLINSILEVSRIESGKAVLEENEADVMLSFTAIEDTMNELADIKDIKLEFEIGEIKNRYVYCDLSRCNRIFVNIISNAIKYSNSGGHVRVRCDQIGDVRDGYGYYRYVFEDDGIGMSEEFQQHVFEQFAREESATVSGIQGSGLGMAVVKSFVDMMNGSIECQSKLGVGTTFTVTLPFRIQDGEYFIDPFTREKVESSDAPREKKHISFAGRKVLLVEDNELNREIAVELLEEEGLVVDEADDGTVAVEIMNRKGPDHYDFILMDIQMPKMDGYEATRAIRAMYPDSHIPIVALSANAFAEDKAASLKAGMDDHVAKPINVKELFGTLSKYL